MARISLRGVIDDTLIRRFQGLASDASKSPTQALTGGGGGATIQTGLRVGARTFATAVQGLNTAITFFNTGKATLDGLGKITDKMISLAEKAGKANSSSEERNNANTEFQRLANQFQKTIKEAKLGNREFLTLSGISEYLQIVGLDREESDSVAAIFDEFVVPAEDDTLASEEIKGPRPAPIPPSAYAGTSRTTIEYSELFDDQVSILTRPNAHKVLNDLKALKDQIATNVEALDSGIKIIGDNLDLVRAAGVAFLDLSNQIEGEVEAEEVASRLRDQIRRDAPAALAQAENLEAMIVAALALNPEELGLTTNN